MMVQQNRPTLTDFAGRTFTISPHEENWERLRAKNPENSDILLLGLGPGDVTDLPFVKAALASDGRIFWLEEPQTLKKLASFPNFRHPPKAEKWLEITDPAQARGAEAYFYRPGLRAAPTFWNEILAAIASEPYKEKLRSDTKRIWLPGNASQLLHQELVHACAELGLEADCRMPYAPGELPDAWTSGKPCSAISVNFRGLDGEGRIFHLLCALRIPLSIWLVDNPWNLLSGIKFPWWRQARLYVTDAGFIPHLRNAGAQSVEHLPLAVAGHMWTESMEKSPPLFVGRPFFPARDAFFKGIRIPDALRSQAMRLMASGKMPDFHWWAEQCRARLWPGTAQRMASLGADECSALNRANWLRAALPTGLEIIGSGWEKYLPDARILPPVDYYGSLREHYAQAAAVLNITSLLLPSSLSQRHFDVWAAGGLLLSDNTPGLDIFPEELTKPMILKKPADIMERTGYFQKNPAKRRDLIRQWRDLLKMKHLYEHRIARLLDNGCS